uniref:Neurotransmitter-gated ion-channel ligand-binding domain-containing protein n=1 Tax=Anopheles coluzzii TaxID=1518534 RepID=A0A8W7PUC9_ANOCL
MYLPGLDADVPDVYTMGWTWPKMGSVLLTAVFIALQFATGLANPDSKRLYDDLLSNYNRLIRPVGNNSDRLTVKMGLRLSQLIDVNLKNQIMTTNVWVEQVMGGEECGLPAVRYFIPLVYFEPAPSVRSFAQFAGIHASGCCTRYSSSSCWDSTCSPCGIVGAVAAGFAAVHAVPLAAARRRGCTVVLCRIELAEQKQPRYRTVHNNVR